MSKEDSPYVILQNLAVDDISKILSSVYGSESAESGENENKIILSFSKKNYGFIRRALPSSAFNSQLVGKVIFFESLKPTQSNGKIAAICLDDQEEVKFALQQLNLLSNYEKNLIIIPRITTLVQEEIDRSGIRLNHVFEYHLDIIPLENYFFIIPCPKCFERCFVEDDITDVYTIARALLRLQIFTGSPRRTFIAGEIASRVNILLEQFKTQVGSHYFQSPQSSNSSVRDLVVNEPFFDDVFIIDRKADLITPLSSQFYYGGMLDEIYDVDFGYLTLPSTVSIPDFPDKREVLLSDENDEVFELMRGHNVIDALSYAEMKRNEIHELTELMKKTSGTTQWSIHAFKAKHMTQVNPILVMHYSLLEAVIDEKKPNSYLTDLEYRFLAQSFDGIEAAFVLLNKKDKKSVINAIRLLCLASIATGGFSSSRVTDIQRRIFNKFGPDAIKDLIGLEKAGLFLSQSLIQSLIRAGIKNPTYVELDKVFNLMVSPDQSESLSITSLNSIKTTFNTIKNYAKKKIDAISNKSSENSNNNTDSNFDLNKPSQNNDEKIDANRPSQNDNNENNYVKQDTDIEKGYDSTVPLIHRIVQAGLNGQWYNQSSPVMKMMKTMGLEPAVYGPNPDDDESDENTSIKTPSGKLIGEIKKSTGIKTHPRRVLVLIIGGVTSTEVQLFVQMGKIIFKDKYEFFVASTNITYGNKLIQSICPVINSKFQ
ncbi:Vacuolar protein-sorting-associated protein 33 [Tritrichomonas musculus]|uniref:Vacuolar protein-sorting-associated protein 33 n=1 Tax=Tritrichomonas musculus TaxID=1915356 RepID=A0ABR2IDC1_9EUKA